MDIWIEIHRVDIIISSHILKSAFKDDYSVKQLRVSGCVQSPHPQIALILSHWMAECYYR